MNPLLPAPRANVSEAVVTFVQSPRQRPGFRVAPLLTVVTAVAIVLATGAVASRAQPVPDQPAPEPLPAPAPAPDAPPIPPVAGPRAGPAGAPAAQQVPLPYVMNDNFGGHWDVQQDGTIGDGGNDVYDGGSKLFLGDNQYQSPQPAAAFDAKANEVLLAPMQINGLNVSRRVAVNAKAGWCRWVEVVENAGPQPAHVQLHLNFDLGGAVQQTRELIDERKTKRTIALAVFDGNHALAMVGAGRGAKVLPRFQPQPGTDQVDVFYDLDVPPKQTVAVLHVQVLRPQFAEVTQFMEAARDKDYLADLPKQLIRLLVNFPHAEKLVGDTEVLRGGLLDVVELRGGDQYRGTLKETSYRLDTSFGPVELPAEQVVGMTTVGTFKPSQLFITADGEVIGGTLRPDADGGGAGGGGIRLQLSSGQVTTVPLHTITRIGYRKRPGEPEEWRFDKPTAFLRDGQRIGIETPAETIPISTIYGTLALKPQSVAALVFQGEDQPVHQVRLTDGSRFAALVNKESFDLRLRSAGGTGPVTLAAASLARLQFGTAPEEPGEDDPTLKLTNGDELVGALSGTLELQTAFDTIHVNGAEVRGLKHASAVEAPAAAGASPGASPTEVQVTLWDGAMLSGRLKGDVIGCGLRCGTAVRVPVALLDEYEQPNPQPTPDAMRQIKAAVAELAAKDWKRRDRAADQLLHLGPGIAGVLKSLRPEQPPEGQKSIDVLVKQLEDARKAAKAPPPPPMAAPVAPNGPADVDGGELAPVAVPAPNPPAERD
jgi:hypothetical protein